MELEKLSFYYHHRKNNSGKNYQQVLNVEFDNGKFTESQSICPYTLLINYKKKLRNQIVFNQVFKLNFYQ